VQYLVNHSPRRRQEAPPGLSRGASNTESRLSLNDKAVSVRCGDRAKKDKNTTAIGEAAEIVGERQQPMPDR